MATEAVWIRSGVAASPSAIEQEVVDLFDAFRDPLLRYLASFGLSRPDAEEVVQEVFLSLFRHLRLEKSRANLRGWLFRVAHNLALKRRLKNLRANEDSSGGAELLIDPAPDPEALAVHRQTRRRLRAVVDALPEQDRRCLALRAEGLRYREIAGILEMSLGAVSISVARSLARIARSAEL
jgi:RNA polymerase sigma-70 factor, ECF subfamily